MINREIYLKDPGQTQLLNNGVATVSDALSAEELRTLRYELETFVCDGQYARGLRRILETYLSNLDKPEQPGVWISGFFGSGKSHLVKMLRALWVDATFPEDKATARGLANLPKEISDLLKELSTAGKRFGGLHATSGTLGAGAGDNVRMALLGIVFRSAGLPEQYPLARFVIWLRDQGLLEPVKQGVEAAGKHWSSELRNLYVSPHITDALLKAYPSFANSPQEARALLKTQYPNVTDVTNTEMVSAIRDALSVDGRLPLTLIVLDEVQQYIGENAERTYRVQEVTEACCKSFGGRLLFVATGQTALTGTPMLQKLMGRFPIPIELSDSDVEAVIRKVILAKKPTRVPAIDTVLSDHSGEISRHLVGTWLESRPEDNPVMVADYPLLPVRRRFWERALRSVDQAGTSAQLRNQLKVVHEATRVTADQPLGSVVAGDFIFDQTAPNLLMTGMLPREIYEHIQTLKSGSADDRLKARLLGLTFLIGKLPRDGAADLGVRATADVLADLLVEDLQAGSAELRKRLPALLAELENTGYLMQVGSEYRLQTRESAAWNDEYRSQLAKILNDPQRVASERTDLLRKECGERLKGVRPLHGKCKEPRNISLHFGTEPPRDADKALYVWIRNGWDEDEKSVEADARATGSQSPTIFVYIPRRSADELKKLLASAVAARATLEIRGVPGTAEGDEAYRAMETRESDARRRLKALVDEIFAGARVLQGGGQEIVEATLADSVSKAAANALIRLYPQFDMADHTQWDKVIEQARKGDGAALEVVDYKGDAEKHPVCAALLKSVGAGKKGADIRKEFENPPYGWPRDAIDGGLYVLLVSGHLRALDANNRSIEAPDLDRQKLTQTHFRVETTTVTAIQRIQVRKLLQELDIPCQSNEELSAIPTLLQKLRELAARAGGEPPRPERPSTRHLDELAGLSGNAQLVAVYNQRETLARQYREWQQTSDAIAARLPAWTSLQDLLEHAGGLSKTTELKEQAEAIRDQRLLLADPDPVKALCDQAAQLLRKVINHAVDHYQTVYAVERETLEQDSNWQKLTPAQRDDILRSHGLFPVDAMETGTVDDILTALETTSLDAWRDRREALPNRFQQARLAAARLLEPKITPVKLPSRTLKSEEEARAWLAEVEARLMAQLKNGPILV